MLIGKVYIQLFKAADIGNFDAAKMHGAPGMILSWHHHACHYPAFSRISPPSSITLVCRTITGSCTHHMQ
jgi:hypothetical protein